MSDQENQSERSERLEEAALRCIGGEAIHKVVEATGFTQPELLAEKTRLWRDLKHSTNGWPVARMIGLGVYGSFLCYIGLSLLLGVSVIGLFHLDSRIIRVKVLGVLFVVNAAFHFALLLLGKRTPSLLPEAGLIGVSLAIAYFIEALFSPMHL